MAVQNRMSIKLFGKIIYVDEAPENAPPWPLGAPPEAIPLPAEVIDAVRDHGGACLTYIDRKNLTESDVKQKYSRLLVRRSHRLMNYLTGVEKEILELNMPLDVIVLDSRGRSFEMPFKKWPSMERHYVLIKDWMKLVNANDLDEFDTVELWCYRTDIQLGFVVNDM